jgi:hypothetical protein
MKYVCKISRLIKAVKSIRSALAKREKKGVKEVMQFDTFI